MPPARPATVYGPTLPALLSVLLSIPEKINLNSLTYNFDNIKDLSIFAA